MRLPIALLVLAGLARPLHAQPSPAAADSSLARFRHDVAAARAILTADGQRLWGAGADLSAAPWIGVQFGGAAPRAWYTDSAPGTRRAEGFWQGALPAGVAPANTAVHWAGRNWAMIILPLPADSAAAVRLLVHEATHTLQQRRDVPAMHEEWETGAPILPAPTYTEGGLGSDLLDRPEGRLWLRLELRALDRALVGPPARRTQAATDALTFRARRYALATPEERRRERALDVTEGMAEYTAWALTAGEGERGAAAFAPTLARADTVSSYVRSFPYATGPAYAFLLDRWRRWWRRQLRSADDAANLQEMLALALPTGRWLASSLCSTCTGSADAVRRAEQRAAAYGADSIRREEESRWARTQRELAELRARFVSGATLRLRPATLRIAFDPRGQRSLGEAGTVMRGLVWTGGDGTELRAPQGALVSADWHELRVPLDSATLEAGPLAAATTWKGGGWTLTLPAGWVATRSGDSWILTPAR